MMYTKEACIETLQEAINAERNGANRIELCSDLAQDGLTPSIDLTKKILKNISIPIKVMIRPRAGSFVYNQKELELMKESIIAFQQLGINNLVTGLLTKKNTIDLHNLKQLLKDFPDVSVTFHKAIDLCPDFETAINLLKTIPQIKSILTSGGKLTAELGISELQKIKTYCSNEITPIVAGRVTNKNIQQLHLILAAKEYHGRKIVGELE